MEWPMGLPAQKWRGRPAILVAGCIALLEPALPLWASASAFAATVKPGHVTTHRCRRRARRRIAVGYLTLQTSPEAALWLDGRNTGAVTPVRRYRVAAGTHLVHLVATQAELQECFIVNIVAGHTLTLRKDISANDSCGQDLSARAD
jgi:hypothetical protein